MVEDNTRRVGVTVREDPETGVISQVDIVQNLATGEVTERVSPTVSYGLATEFNRRTGRTSTAPRGDVARQVNVRSEAVVAQAKREVEGVVNPAQANTRNVILQELRSRGLVTGAVDSPQELERLRLAEQNLSQLNRVPTREDVSVVIEGAEATSRGTRVPGGTVFSRDGSVVKRTNTGREFDLVLRQTAVQDTDSLNARAKAFDEAQKTLSDKNASAQEKFEAQIITKIVRGTPLTPDEQAAVEGRPVNPNAQQLVFRSQRDLEAFRRRQSGAFGFLGSGEFRRRSPNVGERLGVGSSPVFVRGSRFVRNVATGVKDFVLVTRDVIEGGVPVVVGKASLLVGKVSGIKRLENIGSGLVSRGENAIVRGIQRKALNQANFEVRTPASDEAIGKLGRLAGEVASAELAVASAVGLAQLPRSVRFRNIRASEVDVVLESRRGGGTRISFKPVNPIVELADEPAKVLSANQDLILEFERGIVKGSGGRLPSGASPSVFQVESFSGFVRVQDFKVVGAIDDNIRVVSRGSAANLREFNVLTQRTAFEVRTIDEAVTKSFRARGAVQGGRSLELVEESFNVKTGELRFNPRVVSPRDVDVRFFENVVVRSGGGDVRAKISSLGKDVDVALDGFDKRVRLNFEGGDVFGSNDVRVRSGLGSRVGPDDLLDPGFVGDDLAKVERVFSQGFREGLGKVESQLVKGRARFVGADDLGRALSRVDDVSGGVSSVRGGVNPGGVVSEVGGGVRSVNTQVQKEVTKLVKSSRELTKGVPSQEVVVSSTPVVDLAEVARSSRSFGRVSRPVRVGGSVVSPGQSGRLGGSSFEVLELELQKFERSFGRVSPGPRRLETVAVRGVPDIRIGGFANVGRSGALVSSFERASGVISRDLSGFRRSPVSPDAVGVRSLSRVSVPEVVSDFKPGRAFESLRAVKLDLDNPFRQVPSRVDDSFVPVDPGFGGGFVPSIFTPVVFPPVPVPNLRGPSIGNFGRDSKRIRKSLKGFGFNPSVGGLFEDVTVRSVPKIVTGLERVRPLVI